MGCAIDGIRGADSPLGGGGPKGEADATGDMLIGGITW